MHAITKFEDLNQFGIRPLTGEADALSFRILCDLTEEGASVFKECFGLPQAAKLADNWNTGAIASVLLPADAIRSLAIIGYHQQNKTVIVTDKLIAGLDPNEHITRHSNNDYYTIYTAKGHAHPWPTVYGTIQRIIQPKGTTRNVHQMTGRSI